MSAKHLNPNENYLSILKVRLLLAENFIKTISFCLLLIAAFFISSYARVVIKIPNSKDDSSNSSNNPLTSDFFNLSAYKEFDGRFWFGGGYFEKGKIDYQEVKEIKGKVTKIQEFDEKLWILASSLYVVKKGSSKPDELKAIEHRNLSSLFGEFFEFDDKLWIITDSNLLYIKKGSTEATEVGTEPNEKDIWKNIFFKEFKEKMWIATRRELFYLEKGENPILISKGHDFGSISGLQIFDDAIFVSSGNGLYYFEDINSIPEQIWKQPVTDIYSFGESESGFTFSKKSKPPIQVKQKLWIATTIVTEEEIETPFVTRKTYTRGGKTEEQYLLFKKGEEFFPITKLTKANYFVRMEEFEGDLIAQSTNQLFRLSFKKNLDNKLEWKLEGSVERMSKVGKTLWASTDEGFNNLMPESGDILTGINKNFDEKQAELAQWAEKSFRDLRITSQVVGDEKNLWFIASENKDGLNSRSKLFHIDEDASIDAELVSTSESKWQNFIKNFLCEKCLVEGRVTLQAKVVDSEGKETYEGNNINFLASAESEKYNYELSQIKEINRELSPGIGKQIFYIVVQDEYGNFSNLKKEYLVVPDYSSLPFYLLFLWFLLAIVILFLAPFNKFCHDLVMNPFVRRFGSLGLIPLLLTVLPFVRRHLFRRYLREIRNDRDFGEWYRRFTYPSEEFRPEKFGREINQSRKILLEGVSGIGKTSYFKHLTAYYAHLEKAILIPKKAISVFVRLSGFRSGILPEQLVFDQLRNYGRMSDKDLNDWFLKQGGFLIFFDGVNEIPDANLRASLSQFVEQNWKANYICLSSQLKHPEFFGLQEIDAETLSKEKIAEIVNKRFGAGKANKIISEFDEETYQLYQIPRDLEFAIKIKERDKDSPLPKTRIELYEITLSPIISKWRESYPILLYERAYEMLVKNEPNFNDFEKNIPEEIINNLSDENSRYLIKIGDKYEFQHNLIKTYLASKYFSTRWQRLLSNKELVIDENWTEMLKFAIPSVGKSDDIRQIMERVLETSTTKDFVGELFNRSL